MVLCCFVSKLHLVDSSAVTLIVPGGYSRLKEVRLQQLAKNNKRLSSRSVLRCSQNIQTFTCSGLTQCHFYISLFVVFLALQPNLVVFSQPSSGR